MIRLLISAVLYLAANAVGLFVADLVLDDLSIEWQSFVLAVLIFTVVEVIAGPLITKIAIKSVPALRGGIALVTTFVGLFVTNILSDGFSITGVWTWVVATLIVWLGALIAALILPLIFLKKAVAGSPSSGPPTTTSWSP